jgi:DHA1 family inner membrane transport protein
VLATLFLGTFAVGCGEMLVVGVLDLLARDLDVSVPAAGSLMTASALGLAIGGPVLTALTIRIDRRSVLIGALAAFVVFTALPVVVTDYHLFLVARVVSGALQGLLIAAAFFIGPAVVAPERAGRAMSIVLSGFAVSTAAGVPVGTLIGHEFGWRGAFVAVLVLASFVLAASLVVIPSAPSGGGGAAVQARSAFAPRVLALLGLFFLVFAANGSALTYLIPFLQHVTGVTGAPLALFLLAYGAATLAGSVGGGRLADATASRTLIAGTAALCAALLTLFLWARARCSSYRYSWCGTGRFRYDAVDPVAGRDPGRPRLRAGLVAAGVRGERRHCRWLGWPAASRSTSSACGP